MPLEDMMWVEKYRPKKLEELVNQINVKERLAPLLEKKGELPHLLLAGPPGSGKTTTALIIAREILGDLSSDYTLSLNASVAPDTPVMVRVGGEIRLVDFQWIAERYYKDLLSKYAYPSDLEVLSLDRVSLKVEFKSVANISRHRASFLAEVDFKGGSVSTTLNHSVMILNDDGELEESAVSDLRKGDLLITFNTEIQTNSTEISAPEFRASTMRGMPVDPATGRALARVPLNLESSWVFGSYMAEGCVALPNGGGGTTVLTYHYPDELDYVERAAAYFRETMGLHTHTHTVVSGSSRRKSGIQLSVCSKPLARFLANHFYSESAPKHIAMFKRIPNFVFNAPAESRIEFLKGYTGDASGVWQKFVRYSSKSKKCLVGTSWLGRVTGLHTSIFEKECRLVWDLPSYSYFVGGLIPARPFARFFERLGKRVGFNWRYEMRHHLYSKKCKALSKTFATTLLKRLNVASLSPQERASLAMLRRLASSCVYTAEITGIRLKPCDGFVYDLTVPGSQTFWGGTTPVLLHNSDERGIDMVRERVKTFARYSDRREGVPFRLIILDESDEMTRDAQTALRRIMEESAQFTRFILLCNYSSGIIEPLQSRCALFRFQRLDEGSVTTHLKEIARKEKVKLSEPKVLSAIYESTNGDLRQAINLLQAASASGEVTLERVGAVTGTTVKGRVGEIMRLALDGEFENARLKMIELTRVYGIPERDFLKFANEELTNQKGDAMGDAVKILAEYDYRLVMGAQPELQLTAMLAELSALKGRKGE